MVVKQIWKTIGEPVREICFISEVLEIRHVIVWIKIPAFYRFRSIPPAKLWIIPVIGHTEHFGDRDAFYSIVSQRGQQFE